MKAAWACALCHHTDIPRSKRKRDLCEDCFAYLAPRGLDWCASCKRRVKADDMRRWGPRGWQCVACQRGRNSKMATYSKAWRERNPDKIRAYGSRAERRTAQRERSARRRTQHREEYNATQRRYYYRHRDAVIARVATWRASNLERSRANGRRGYMRRKLRILRAWRQSL